MEAGEKVGGNDADSSCKEGWDSGKVAVVMGGVVRGCEAAAGEWRTSESGAMGGAACVCAAMEGAYVGDCTTGEIVLVVGGEDEHIGGAAEGALLLLNGWVVPVVIGSQSEVVVGWVLCTDVFSLNAVRGG